MRAASVTETSRQYNDYDGSHTPPTATEYPSQPTIAQQKPAVSTPASHHTCPVPISSTLPTTVAPDLIPPSAQWVNSSSLPELIHPSTWREVSHSGPYPFTTLIHYRLPQSQTDVTWESRKHRRQVEQESYPDALPAVAARRAALRRPWWHRILRVHLWRWSWWAVLWFNVGSHALLYAAICLFIPYFNTGTGVYQANTGWSSNVLAAAFWLAGSVFEIAAVCSVKPAGKWYQVPKPLLPSNRRKVDPRTYDCAYVDAPLAGVRTSGVWRRMDFWLCSTRLVAYLAFLVATIAYSGAFEPLTNAQRDGAVFAMGILAGVLLIVTSYLQMVECCHQWLPWKRAGSGATLTHIDWWHCIFSLVASFAFLAYYIDLTCQPELLDQRQGPAYPYIVMAAFFTASDWMQAVEQGEHFVYERATPSEPVAAAPMNAYAAKGAPPVPTRPAALAVDDSAEHEHRMAIQSPRGVEMTTVQA